MKRTPLGKTDAEPMEEEADSDEEEGINIMKKMFVLQIEILY